MYSNSLISIRIIHEQQINPTTMKPEAAQYKESRHKEDEKENGDPGRQERRARGRKKADGEIKVRFLNRSRQSTFIFQCSGGSRDGFRGLELLLFVRKVC